MLTTEEREELRALFGRNAIILRNKHEVTIAELLDDLEASEALAESALEAVEDLTLNADDDCIWLPLLADDAAESILERRRVERDSCPDDLRALGWLVAVHNDYRQGGELFTFWLLAKGNECVKGEGRTDAEALNEARAAIVRLRSLTLNPQS